MRQAARRSSTSRRVGRRARRALERRGGTSGPPALQTPSRRVVRSSADRAGRTRLQGPDRARPVCGQRRLRSARARQAADADGDGGFASSRRPWTGRRPPPSVRSSTGASERSINLRWDRSRAATSRLPAGSPERSAKSWPPETARSASAVATPGPASSLTRRSASAVSPRRRRARGARTGSGGRAAAHRRARRPGKRRGLPAPRRRRSGATTRPARRGEGTGSAAPSSGRGGPNRRQGSRTSSRSRSCRASARPERWSPPHQKRFLRLAGRVHAAQERVGVAPAPNDDHPAASSSRSSSASTCLRTDVR